MKKIIGPIFILSLLCASARLGAEARVLNVSGLVRQPLRITLDELSRFQSIGVRLNEVARDGSYGGAFWYRGVPMRYILELAGVRKEEASFSKSVDLAVVVRSRSGKRTVLSWGEVFYRNPAEVVVAFEAAPVRPMKKCQDCHKPGEFEKWLTPLSRPIGFPKLVAAGDIYADRSLEEVMDIEVVNLRPSGEKKKADKLYSPMLQISLGEKSVSIGDLTKYPRIEVAGKQVGDGKGFHGARNFTGAPLADLLRRSGLEPSLDAVLLVSAKDGYRSLLSAGELFLSPAGRSIILADAMDGKPIGETGKFILVFPDDLSADRWVKAVEKIEIISPGQKPTLYIIGVGCGDTSLVTLEALSSMGKADVFVCTDDIRDRFSRPMGGKPVLFDPLLNLEHYFRKKNPGLSAGEAHKRVEELRVKNIRAIREALEKGQTVAFLEYGDPTIYGSWTYWLLENFKKEQVKVVPGVSAFNAANAMIGRNVSERGSVVITVPDGIRANEGMLKAVAEHGDTLCIFIGLREMKNLMPLFEKYYKKETPVYVVYKAGYSESGRLIKSTLGGVIGVVERDAEQFLGVIYIGEGLK